MRLRKDRAQRLLDDGVQLYRRENFNDALLKFQKALSGLSEKGDRAGEGSARFYLGMTYGALGQGKEELAQFELALPIFREVGNRPMEASTLGNLGHIYAEVDNLRCAKAYLEQALPIFREVGDEVGEARALQSLGFLCFREGRRDEAVAYWKQVPGATEPPAVALLRATSWLPSR